MGDLVGEFRYLCHSRDIEEGQAKGFGPFEGGRRKVIVVRRNGMFYGWLDACPHYSTGTPMAWRTDAYMNCEKTHLTCHSHGAMFEIETGECVLGPCLGQALTAVEITMNDDGEIFVVKPWEGERT
ncbi:Rieske (2Fe-2S) protein [Agrobacterium sp. lyk4-40-TYG-31]|uniref:Rieske (2Fe-2S) protein n=1 Tax=Agrobacterium sp. lyk4-40-TYG-31 TaxID=3040276 RepID=UPI0025504451|nr:Rieske (2Fe-2S) protein [Agrobacterium sp. lyk4-40-TYG-31]